MKLHCDIILVCKTSGTEGEIVTHVSHFLLNSFKVFSTYITGVWTDDDVKCKLRHTTMRR